MGVDTDIYLPPYVRVNDVATVVGILLGKPATLCDLRGGSYYTRVDGVRAVANSVSSCCDIVVDGEPPRRLFYAYESGNPNNREHDTGWHCIIARSRAETIALGVGLVRFFGGIVDFSDCDDTDIDLEVSIKDSAWGHDFSPNDGDEWGDFQQAIYAVQPLTKTDIARYDDVAAYS